MAETTPIYLDEFKAMHPADLADRLQRMPTEEARHILTELPVDAASAALAELEDMANSFLRATSAVEEVGRD